MHEIMRLFAGSEPFQVLAAVSVIASACYDMYLRRVTSRTTRTRVLSADLEALFEKLQAKWAARKAERRSQ